MSGGEAALTQSPTPVKKTMPASDPVQELVESRRHRIQESVGRPLQVPEGTEDPPLTPQRRAFLLEELEELYWNDLEWENITEEERMEGGGLTELTFPGVLAMVDGLLLEEVPEDAATGPEPRPEVVQAFVEFLSRRVLELREAAAGEPSEEGDLAALELRMTEALLDRVLVAYHRVSPEDVEPLGEL